MSAYRQGRAAACILLSLLAATACSEATGPEQEGAGAFDGNVLLSLYVPAAAAPAAGLASLVPVTDDAGRTLDIQQVQIVFEEIELEPVGEDDGGQGATAAFTCSGGHGDDCGDGGCWGDDDDCGDGWCWGDDHDDDGDGDCHRHHRGHDDDDDDDFEAGPVLVDLPLDGGVLSLLGGEVPAGSYDELELEIDRPNDRKATHEAFREEHPDWPRNASIRVRGTFDPGTGAQAFDVFLNVELDLELEFDEPLVIEADSTGVTGPVNVTLSVDVNQWFVGEDGLFFDPRALSADFGLRIKAARNIRSSFAAFIDRDRNGRKDHHGRD